MLFWNGRMFCNAERLSSLARQAWMEENNFSELACTQPISLIVSLHKYNTAIKLRTYYVSIMFDKACIVCQDVPALHKITFTKEEEVITHSLCHFHFQEAQNTQNFFSKLETSPSQPDLYDIVEFMVD